MQPNTPQNQQPFQPSAPQGPGPNPQYQAPPQGAMPQPSAAPMTASQLKPQKPIALIILLVLFVLLFLGAAGYAFSMMSSRNDFRDNVEEKILAANEVAVTANTEELNAEFIEKEKEPYVVYTGPSQFGSVSVTYPKTWSAYVDESGKGSAPIDGYFHPGFVPGVDSGISFALKLEVLESSYDKELDKFASAVKKGTVKIAPVTLDKVPSVAGSRADGLVDKDKNGSVVLFPLRDKTIKVSVLSDQFIGDFNDIILKNMSFIP